MPRVNWDIDASDVDGFDRDAQYQPYSGPEPRNGVYLFQVKVLKYAARTRDKLAQLRIGLELVPREGREDDDQYEGYFILNFAPVSPQTAFRYVPFLDAIGVSGREFKERTITDADGNVKKIGRWRNDGKQYILAQIKDDNDQNGNLRKAVGWMGAPDAEYDEEEEDYADEEEPF